MTHDPATPDLMAALRASMEEAATQRALRHDAMRIDRDIIVRQAAERDAALAERDAARGLAADLEAQLAQVEALCDEWYAHYKPFAPGLASLNQGVLDLAMATRAVLHPEPAEPSDLVFPALRDCGLRYREEA